MIQQVEITLSPKSRGFHLVTSEVMRQLLKSYNVPELMRAPITQTPQQMAETLKGEGIPAKYVKKR